MPEMPPPHEHHCDAVVVGGLDHLIVAHAVAGLDHRVVPASITNPGPPINHICQLAWSAKGT